jgi:hypothetical protein
MRIWALYMHYDNFPIGNFSIKGPGYLVFKKREDNCVKVVLDPWAG